jgi:hypothetical protein
MESLMGQEICTILVHKEDMAGNDRFIGWIWAIAGHGSGYPVNRWRDKTT